MLPSQSKAWFVVCSMVCGVALQARAYGRKKSSEYREMIKYYVTRTVGENNYKVLMKLKEEE
ncbi:hypothetical protein MTR_8g094560 [Medicago truncatula]|uniref:Transmembrane protein n=2 Tax=Medicago truncatula TaxID=3880 RepID=G7LF12_MEDTR|nr:hypothetical protein MTR_8g094560 [Medicago truncatula]